VRSISHTTWRDLSLRPQRDEDRRRKITRALKSQHSIGAWIAGSGGVRVEDSHFPSKDMLIESYSYFKLVVDFPTLFKIVYGLKISCAHEQKSFYR
jgi:hypothetical protein